MLFVSNALLEYYEHAHAANDLCMSMVIEVSSSTVQQHCSTAAQHHHILSTSTAFPLFKDLV